MDILDDPDKYPPGSDVFEEAEKRFQEYYLRPLGDDAKYVQLESGFRLVCQGLYVDELSGRNAYE